MKHLLIFIALLSCIKANASLMFVTQTGAGNNSGNSWANAVNGSGVGLALLFNQSGPTDTIWVATGIYYTNSATTLTATAASTLTSFIINGAKIYGGFAGTETNLNQRNIVGNPTILSGNIGQDTDPTNNARHVVKMGGENPVLDGFIIEEGYADGGIFVGNSAFTNENIPLHGSGGGLLIYAQPPIIADTIMQTFTIASNTLLTTTVRNCVFRYNYSSGYSSGVYGGSAAAVFASWTTKVIAQFENCVFKKNTANVNGGAIYATSSKVQPLVYKRNNVTYTNLQPDSINGDLTLKLDSCSLDSNQSPNGSAGAIYFDITNTINTAKFKIRAFIDGCNFTYNTAYGDACIKISSDNGNKTGFDSLYISNSTFSFNKSTQTSGRSSCLSYASDDTAALFNYHFYNNRFSQNKNMQWGSEGVFLSKHSGADKGIIRKCNFTNNKSTFGPACLYFETGNTSPYLQAIKSQIIIDSCNFYDNSDSIGGVNGYGAIYFRYFNPTDTFIIQHTTISNNRGGNGTAYFIVNGPLKFINCVVDSNNSNPTNIVSPITILGSKTTYSIIRNSKFRGNNYMPTTNSSQQTSGAIHYQQGAIDTTTNFIINSIFIGNRGGSYGGAVVSSGSTYGFEKLIINNSVFKGNSTSGVGGAVASFTPWNGLKRGQLEINNCLITGNRAELGGGGISFDDVDGKLTIINSTIADNYVAGFGQFGAGILFSPQGSPDTCKIYNTAVWGNVANGNGHAEVTAMGSGQPKIKLYNTIVKDGFNPQLYSQDDKISWQNLYLFNPLFVNAQPAINAPTVLGDYHLQFCSPAINRGDNNYAINTVDIDDSTRIKNTTVDIGAYESGFDNGIEIPIASAISTTVCEYNNIQLTAANVSSAASLTWYGANGFSSNVTNPTVIAPNHQGISDSVVVYTLEATYANMCSIIDTVAVLVKTGPYVNITNADTSLCGFTFSTNLASTFVPGVTTPDYYWRIDSLTSALAGSNASLNINLTTPVNRKYYLMGKDPYTNCAYVDSVQINLKPKPATSAITGNMQVQTNAIENYSVTPTTGSLYNWQIQSGVQTAGGNTNSIQVTWGNMISTGSVKVVETSSNGCLGDTVFLNNVTVLPVTLILFEANQISGRVLLNWQTASETNNSHFEVEKSVDAKSFAKIGVVAGRGTSNLLNKYIFWDEESKAKVQFYRLKQVDFNGNYTYSKMVHVTNDEQAYGLMAYPNPANSKITVSGLSEPAFMFDARGRIVKTIHQSGEVDVSDLDKGIYIIKSGDAQIRLLKP